MPYYVDLVHELADEIVATVNDGAQPAANTGTFTYKWANPLTIPKQLPDPTVDAFAYCKGDGSIDDYTNMLQAVDVAQTLGSRYNVTVLVECGVGLFKLSQMLVLPSYTGLRAPGGTRYRPGAVFQPWTGFPDDADSYLLAAGAVEFTGSSHATTIIDGIASTSSLAVGQPIVGPGVPLGTTISAVAANSVTLSQAATTTRGAVTFAAGIATGCKLDGIGAFINTGYQHVGGIYWQANGGTIQNIRSSNSPLTAFVLAGSDNHLSEFLLGGGAYGFDAGAGGTSTTVNGSQMLPSPGTGVSISLAVADGTKANSGGGYATISGTGGVVAYTGVSNNNLLGVTGGYGTALNGAAITFITFTQSSLTAYRGLGLHCPTGAQDNLIVNGDVAGDSVGAALTMRTPQGYGCAMYTAHGGIDRVRGLVIETADTGCYFAAPQSLGQMFQHNRVEWTNGHGLIVAAACGYSQFTGNKYQNNGLSRHDTYAHIFNLGVRNSFVGESFAYRGNSTSGTNVTSTAVYDLGFGLGSALNTYGDLQIDDTAWVSAPFVILDRSAGDVPAIRQACDRWRRFSALPTTGTFVNGERFSLAGPVAGSALDYVVNGVYTQGTIAGSPTATTSTSASPVTLPDGRTCLASQVVTLNAGGGANVPLGAILGIAGVTFTAATGGNLGSGGTAGNQVLAKAGDTIYMSGTAGAAVAGATVTFGNSGVSNSPRPLNTVQSNNAVAANAGGQPLNGSLTIAAGAQSAIGTLGVTNAALGNRVDLSYNQDLQGVELFGWVSAAGTVSYYFRNGTAGSVTLAAGSVTAWVRA